MIILMNKMNQKITDDELKQYEELIDIDKDENKPDQDKQNKLGCPKNNNSFFKRFNIRNNLINIIIPAIILLLIVYVLTNHIFPYNASFRLIKEKSKKEAIKTAGDIMIEIIQNNINPKISLSVGGISKNIFKYLIDKYEQNEISFINTTFFELYEYCGLDKKSKKSNSYFLSENFLDHIDVKESNIYLINNFGDNCLDIVEKYKEILNQNVIDLQLINIEDNYSLGINYPGIALESKTHISQLSQNKKKELANMFGIEIKDVPSEGITQGINDIIKSKNILVVSSGKENSEGLKNLMKGKLDIDRPISTLKNHNGIIYVVADEEACSLL